MIDLLTIRGAALTDIKDGCIKSKLIPIGSRNISLDVFDKLNDNKEQKRRFIQLVMFRNIVSIYE